MFKAIIAAGAIQRRNISLQYLNNVDLFKGLEQYEKLKLIDGLKVVHVEADEYIFHEGDHGDHFYIIEEGAVDCLKEHEDGAEVVRGLSEGMHFGEVALINNVKRTLSVRATQPCKLLSLTRAAFTRILGSIKQFLKEDYRTEKHYTLDGSFVSENSRLDASGLSHDLYGIHEEVGKEDDQPLDLRARDIQHRK